MAASLKMKKDRYMKQILKRFKMVNCHVMINPCDNHQVISLNDFSQNGKKDALGVPFKKTEKFDVPTVAIRPNLAVAIHKVSQYHKNPIDALSQFCNKLNFQVLIKTAS